jgi:hypothetical protein
MTPAGRQHRVSELQECSPYRPSIALQRVFNASRKGMVARSICDKYLTNMKTYSERPG